MQLKTKTKLGGQTGLSDDGVQNGKKFKSYITKASKVKGPHFDGQQQ